MKIMLISGVTIYKKTKAAGLGTVRINCSFILNEDILYLRIKGLETFQFSDFYFP